MKRKAILIGNTRNLPGTPNDMLSVANHFISHQGGAWLPDEFEILLNQPAKTIVDTLEDIRKENNDFVIVYFTGHGHLQGNTITEVNPEGELVDEEVLQGLAIRQINIFDCCRGVATTSRPIFRRRRGMSTSLCSELDEVRRQYEDLIINQSAPQSVIMYSCDRDESSYVLKDKSCSHYTKNLIESITDILKTEDVARVYACHEETAIRTISSVNAEHSASQHPVIVPTKCSAAVELPLGFNPIIPNNP